MRPIDKGQAPFVATEYAQFRNVLTERLGAYCSYCEHPLSDLVPIEHVQPKSLYPALINEWDNLLLACYSCNSAKGDADVILAQYRFPDTSNTWHYLTIDLDTLQYTTDDEAAFRTLHLISLNSGKKIARRRAANLDMQDAMDDLEQAGYPAASNTLLALVRAKGYLTLWLKHLEHKELSPQYRASFIAQFPGTAES